MSEINVRKRGKKWQYQFEAAKVEGKRKQITKSGFNTKKEALDAGIKALAEYNNSGMHFVPSELSLSDYLDLWLNQYCKINLLTTTYNNYEKKIKLHIKPHLGIYKINALTSSTLQDFINLKFNEGYSRNTLSVIKGILVNSLDYATTTLGFIKYNPMHSVRLPQPRAVATVPTRSKERILLSDNFIEVLFNRFKEPHTAYIELLLGYTCGLRLGEAFAIDLEKDINFKEGYLNVNWQVQYENGFWTLVEPKYNSRRIIKLDDFTLNKLKLYKERHFNSIKFYKEYYRQLKINDENQLNYDDGIPIHLLSTRDDGTYIQPRIMQHVGRVVHYKLYNEEQGIDIEEFIKYDFHSLRHKHATMLLEAGANIKDVQIRLGHKNIETTLGIYAHTSKKIQDNTATILSKLNVLN